MQELVMDAACTWEAVLVPNDTVANRKPFQVHLVAMVMDLLDKRRHVHAPVRLPSDVKIVLLVFRKFFKELGEHCIVCDSLRRVVPAAILVVAEAVAY